MKGKGFVWWRRWRGNLRRIFRGTGSDSRSNLDFQREENRRCFPLPLAFINSSIHSLNHRIQHMHLHTRIKRHLTTMKFATPVFALVFALSCLSPSPSSSASVSLSDLPSYSREFKFNHKQQTPRLSRRSTLEPSQKSSTPPLSGCSAHGSHGAAPSAENKQAVNDNPGNSEHSMKMAFNSDLPVTILFESWAPNASGEFIGALLAVFFAGFFYEGLRVYQTRMEMHFVAKPPTPEWKRSLSRFGIMFVIVTISYCLMLVVMTYNVALFFSTVAGIASGSAVWGRWKIPSVDLPEVCC